MFVSTASLYVQFSELCFRFCHHQLLEMNSLFPVSACTLAITTLLLYPLTHLANAAPTVPPAPSFISTNQSNAPGNIVPFTTSLGDSAYHCTSAPAWSVPGWVPADCQVALLRMSLSDADRHGDHDFEFTAPGAHPTSPLPEMSTPRRYTSGKLRPPDG